MLKQARRLATWALVVVCWVLSGCRSHQTAARLTARPAPASYLADLEKDEGHGPRYFRVLQNGEQFRVVQFRSVARTRPLTVELHDASDPYLVVLYHPREKRGGPTPGSCIRAFWGAVSELGEEQARKRFRVSGRVPGKEAFGGTAPNPGLHPFAPEPGMTTLRTVGNEPICGLPCEIREQVSSVGARSGRSMVLRSWVERKSGLVLRSERTLSFGESSPLPPRRIRIRATSVRFDPPCSLTDFQPPAGSTVRLPEIFSDAKLPSGVRRVTVPGMGSSG